MIGIINYGLGNIQAFANIYKKLDIEYKIVSSKEELIDVDKIILPGVGAFDYAMTQLNNSGMRDSLDDMVLNKKVPVIGICVGMQMLAKSSDEGVEKGLGWIDGVVKKFDSNNFHNNEPLPHMGWNQLTHIKESRLTSKLSETPRFYFLHSYYFKCNNKDDVISNSNYGEEFNTIINHEHIYGIQCHPEKSHNNGILILKNFGEL